MGEAAKPDAAETIERLAVAESDAMMGVIFDRLGFWKRNSRLSGWDLGELEHCEPIPKGVVRHRS
jgi:hypothetical protein